MKLSICIFAYNLEKFIAQAIESVLCQVMDFEYEIVIGEDCSTDSTREIVANYQNKNPERISVLYNSKNLGMMENVSHTISQCRGEFIALLDGDDYWISNRKLQAQVNFLTANPEYVLCFHDAKILKMNGQWDNITCCGADHKKNISFNDVVCDVHIPTSSIVFKRSSLAQFPPKWFNDLHATDRPLFLMLLSNGPGFYFNELWSVYRKHPMGYWTRQHYQSQWLIHLQIYKVLNQHTKGRYKQSFCKCETRVSYNLAVNLVKDLRVKRALCYFRKYIRSAGKTSFSKRFDFYFKILFFIILYFQSRLRFYTKRTTNI